MNFNPLNTSINTILSWHHQIRLIGLSFVVAVSISCSFSYNNMAIAQDTSEATFSSPSHLAKAKIDNLEQLRVLLISEEFLSELKTLATQLEPAVVSKQNMFNSTAIMSMRAEYQSLLQVIAENKNPLAFYHYTLHAQSLLKQNVDKQSKQSDYKQVFKQEFQQQLTDTFAAMSDEELVKANAALGWSVPRAEDYLLNVFKKYQGLEQLNTEQVIDIIVNTQLYIVLAEVIPFTTSLFAIENKQRYLIEPEILITTATGVELAATIVRKKNDKQKRPVALQFTIYADVDQHINTAIHAAAHGYVGVVVNSRGKRSSSNNITPWEHDGEDATAAIDWLSKQRWSDGQVVMYGGSYNGFTQWAAAKYMHPALKTIVPYAAASPITGLPYENNIVLTANYEWAFYVTNNKTTDPSVYSDWQLSNQRTQNLYTSGRPIADIDKIDGKANPWFQLLLSHPSYDEYYQAMLPYQQDYANINIPVLSITGYFDGGQISAIDFLKRHYQYNKNANHTLLIGPYNHFTAQNIPRSHEGNYQLDEVALEKDTEELTFAWFDHLLFNKAKPKLLKSKVNYQLMGSNTWQHHNSYEQLNQQTTRYYLGSKADKEGRYTLTTSAEPILNAVSQTIDMTDRTEQRNINHWSVIEDKLNEPNGLVFVSPKLDKPMQFAGSLSGYFSIAINKKDVDIGYNLYEQLPDGKVFHLARYISRASYAKDMSKRQLLVPNQKTIVPITNTRMSAKLLNKGSRIVLVLNVNKNADAQVNLGTGKDVNNENIDEVGEPLTISWFNDSQINIPLSPWVDI
ncbi:CocE/NonD family hydrolase [Paraglaciecola hydrolytica]|nr:CocE/NonD family hydrolase [Paraglaciecola hydrolytica]